MGSLVFIESEGLLYRGASANEPEEIWHYPNKQWVKNPCYRGRLADEWGQVIGPERAEALKHQNWNAEHFRYYDTPPWSPAAAVIAGT